MLETSVQTFYVQGGTEGQFLRRRTISALIRYVKTREAAKHEKQDKRKAEQKARKAKGI